ncbi:MAG: DNA-processing protein DprA [Georgenia sp.]
MPELPFDTADPRLAAAAWCRIAEPGDEAAGALTERRGVVEALDWLAHTAARDAVGADRSSPWHDAVRRWVPRLEGLDIRRELDVLARLGGHLLLPGDQGWPAGLDDLGAARPFALWVRGTLPSESGAGRAVAIVGARAATAYGQRVASELAVGLAEAGVCVVSGGAYGIDAAAHRGALAAEGATVAFLAGGVDRLYPAGNSDLLEAVAAATAVVAEVPPGSAPTRNRFLARNRLIAAGTTGTVVVEAAWRSGALSTAAHAARLARHVGAVPGPVTSMASAGCHRLLRESDAVCVTTASEVLELIAPMGEHLPLEPPVRPGLLDGLDPVAARLLDALPARGAAAIPNLVRAAGLAPAEVRSALGVLELAGRVERAGGGWRRRCDR